MGVSLFERILVENSYFQFGGHSEFFLFVVSLHVPLGVRLRFVFHADGRYDICFRIECLQIFLCLGKTVFQIQVKILYLCHALAEVPPSAFIACLRIHVHFEFDENQMGIAEYHAVASSSCLAVADIVLQTVFNQSSVYTDMYKLLPFVVVYDK